MDLSVLLSGDALVSLVTLTAMEIVLGIDNVVFIAILVGRLPTSQQNFARRLGLTLALVIRVGLLLMISWIMGLTEPLFSVLNGQISGRDLILIGGGLFLIVKATWEIYDKVEGDHAERERLAVGDQPAARVPQVRHAVHVGDRLGDRRVDPGAGDRERGRGRLEAARAQHRTEQVVLGRGGEREREDARVAGEDADLHVAQVLAHSAFHDGR